MAKATIALLFWGAITGCGGTETKQGGTADVYGSTVQTYVVLDGGKVVEVGYTMPQAAAQAADGQVAGTKDGWHADFPAEAAAQTVVSHLLLDFFHEGLAAPWNHAFFGTHFYFADQASRLNVTCPEEAVTNLEYVPAQYRVLDICAVTPGTTCGCVAGEGVHAVDLSAPEVQMPAGEFTHNLRLGFHAGALAFFEPMITTAYLAGSASFDSDIRQPATYPPGTSGKLFPMHYSATFADGTWTIALTELMTIP